MNKFVSPFNAGHSSNSRIVWEHTRGRYRCLQCSYSAASRKEMTQHLEDHRKNPPPPGRLEGEMGEILEGHEPQGERGRIGRLSAAPPTLAHGLRCRTSTRSFCHMGSLAPPLTSRGILKRYRQPGVLASQCRQPELLTGDARK